MVAVDSGGLGQTGNGAALGGLAGAVGADGVTQNTGGPGGAAVFVDSCHIHSLGQSLGSDAGDITAVLAGTGAFQLQRAGGIGHGQDACSVIGGSVPVVQGDAVGGNILGSEEVVDAESALEGDGGLSGGKAGVVGEGALLHGGGRGNSLDHVCAVCLGQRLLSSSQSSVCQSGGVVTEVQLSLSAVVQHSGNQLLQTCIGGVLQLAGSVLNSAVGSQLGVSVGAVLQLGIDGQVNGIAQILGMDALRAGVVTAGSLIEGVAGNHMLSGCHAPGGDLGAVGDHTHLHHILNVLSGVEGVDGDHVLELQRGRLQSQSGYHGGAAHRRSHGAALGVAQGQAAVGILGQGEGDRHIAGHEHLLTGAGGGVEEVAGGVAAVGLSHVPVGIVTGLQEHIAVLVEGSGELAVDKLVLTHICVVILAAVVGAVDEANQIVAGHIPGLGLATAGTLAAHIGVAGGSGLIAGVGVLTGAAGVGGVTAGGTGRLGDHGGVLVTQCGNLFLVAVTAGLTGVGGGAGGGAGSGGRGGDVAVTQSSNGLLEAVATDLTAVRGGAGSGTGSIHHGGGVAVSSQRQSLGLAVATDAAGLGLGAGSGAGGRHGNSLVAVTQRCGPVAGVAVGTVLAVIQSVAGCGTGGLHQLSGVVVTGGRDGLVVRVLTVGAGVGLDTGRGTGGSGGHLGGVVMTGGRNGLGIAVVTAGTVVDLQTGNGTGGSGGLAGVGMTGGRDGLGIGLATHGAGVGHHAGLQAGSGSGHLGNIVMVTNIATDAAGAADKSVRGHGSSGEVEHGAGLDLTGGGGVDLGAAPVGPCAPAGADHAVGILLCVNRHIEVPVGVGTDIAVVEAVAVVADVVPVGFIRGNGAVPGVETVVVAGLGSGGVGVTLVAPVVVDIANDLVGVHCDLGGGGGRSGDLLGSVVVTAVEYIGGQVAGGPALHIANLASGADDPVLVEVTVAVNSLLLELAGAHAAGNGIQPHLSQLIGCNSGVVTALGAGQTIACITLAGGSAEDLGGVGVGAYGGGGEVAQSQGIVLALNQREGDLHIGRNHHLLANTGGGVFEDRSCAAGIGLGHVPIGIALSLQEHIAFLGEGSGELAVHELVGAHVLIVSLTAVVLTVDEAYQIVVDHIVGVLAATVSTLAVNIVVVAAVATDGADAVHILMSGQRSGLVAVQRGGLNLTGGGFSDLGGAPVGPDAPAGAGGIAGVALGVDRHCEVPVGIITGGGIVETVAVIAGVVPVSLLRRHGAVVSMEAVVAAGLGGRGVGIAVIAPVIVQVAGDGIGLHNGLFGGGLGSLNGIAQVVISIVQDVGGAEAVGPALHIGDSASAGDEPVGAEVTVAVGSDLLEISLVHALGNSVQPLLGQVIGIHGVILAAEITGQTQVGIGAAGSGSDHLGGVSVSALSQISLIAQTQGVVTVDGQSEGDLHIAGNKQLLVGTGGGVVQSCLGAGSVSLGHVPGAVALGLDANIAVLTEHGGQLIVDEAVSAHVLIVALAGIVSAVDVAEQVVIVGIDLVDRNILLAAGCVAAEQAGGSIVAQGVAGVGAIGRDRSSTGLGIDGDGPGAVVGDGLLGLQVIGTGGSGIEVCISAGLQGEGAGLAACFQSQGLNFGTEAQSSAALGDSSLSAVVGVLGGTQSIVVVQRGDDDLVACLQSGNIGDQSRGLFADGGCFDLCLGGGQSAGKHRQRQASDQEQRQQAAYAFVHNLVLLFIVNFLFIGPFSLYS